MRIRTAPRILGISGIVILCAISNGMSQQITAPGGQGEDYTNYATEGYRNYSQEFLALKHYDDFGNFLVEGLNVFRMEDLSPSPVSGVIKYRIYTNWFQNLLVAQDKYKGFATSLIIGDAIRTKFTSLTLDRARLNGIRWDGSFRNNKFTAVSSQISDPVNMPFTTQVTGITELAGVHDWNRYLMGLHWESEIGDVLRIGASYVNLHQKRSQYEQGTTRGAVAETLPKTAYVRISDDSPGDDSGPVIFGPPAVTINGKRTDIHPVEVLSYPLTLTSGGQVEFTLPIPSSATSVVFTITLANDYRIETGHEYLPDQTQPDVTERTTYRLVKRATGNVKDQSNKRVVSFEYGLNSGRTLLGINFEANIWGARIQGEFVQNELYSKYPIAPGQDYVYTSRAYYVQGKRRFGPFTVGGDVFRIDPDFMTSLNTYSLDATSTSYGDQAGAEPRPGGVYDWLVDDNDDDDRYHDGNLYYDFEGNLVYRDNPEERFSVASPRPDAGIFPGLDENNDGIPDNDRNSNGAPDYVEPFLMFDSDPQRFDFGDDWNNNGIIDARENDRRPDYPYKPDLKGHHTFINFQPFRNVSLTYGVLRHEEIGSGGHNYVEYGKAELLRYVPRWYRLNVYHVSKRVRDDIPDPTYEFDEDLADYSFPVFRNDPLLMKNSLVHTTYVGTQFLRLRGFSIENNFKHESNAQKEIEGQPESSLTFWALINKISFQYKLFRNTLTLTPGLKHRQEKWILDSGAGGATQPETVIHNMWVMPIIRADLFVTPTTVFRAGFQGFSLKDINPNLNDGDLFLNRYRNFLKPEDDANHKIFMAMVTNASEYGGYKIQFNLGYQIIRENFVQESQATRNRSFTRFFVRVIAGW